VTLTCAGLSVQAAAGAGEAGGGSEEGGGAPERCCTAAQSPAPAAAAAALHQGTRAQVDCRVLQSMQLRSEKCMDCRRLYARIQVLAGADKWGNNRRTLVVVRLEEQSLHAVCRPQGVWITFRSSSGPDKDLNVIETRPLFLSDIGLYLLVCRHDHEHILPNRFVKKLINFFISAYHCVIMSLLSLCQCEANNCSHSRMTQLFTCIHFMFSCWQMR